MSYDPVDLGTGSTGSVKVLPYGGHVSVNSGTRDDRPTFYRQASQGSGSTEAPSTTRKPATASRPGVGTQGRTTPDPSRRDAVRRGVQRALREAEAMLSAADGGELTRLSNKAFELRDTLQDLWALREEREEDWGDLLNILQIALEMDEYENLSVAQCKAVRDVIADHLSVHAADLDDIDSSVRLLRRSGLDPFGSSSSATSVQGEGDPQDGAD